MKNKLLHREKYKELLYIVNKNIPNISATETIELFKKLSNTGCSAAMLANLLVDQMYTDEKSFNEIFGFSILTKDKKYIDCNKLMVDIFSKLYGIMKAIFIEYDTYSFDTVKSAVNVLLKKEVSTDREGIIELFDNGFVSDGFDSSGNLLFKSCKPKITNYIENCEQIAKQMFGIYNIKTIDELKTICKSNNIIFEYKDLEINEKLTGLGTANFNFWSNYYLKLYNIEYDLNNVEIPIRDFENDYNSFMEYINNLMSKGYSISVSSGPNRNIYMHDNKHMSWTKISSESYGHIMLFKGFNKNFDIIVSSYGKDYVIPKEYFEELEFNKINKIKEENNNQLDETKKFR